jgi:hypothetical protein
MVRCIAAGNIIYGFSMHDDESKSKREREQDEKLLDVKKEKKNYEKLLFLFG